MAIIGTVFGIAVSVGMGAMQINSGASRVLGLPETSLIQLLLIAAIIVVASISVARGLDKGIKRLSNLNIAAAVLLLIFVLVAGPTLYLLRGTIEAIGGYLVELPRLALWNDAFEENPGWQGGWTVFYWAWTITWSPFVGIFIARISRGRTVREFVAGVLGLPVAFSLIWFGVFGTSSFLIEEQDGGLVERVAVEGDIPGALFEFLSNYPAATFMSGLGILIVVIFFTTSVDSAAMVTDMIASGKEPAFAPTHQKVTWAVLMGAVAAVLLAATGEGGLSALQQIIIVIGLPFFVMGFIMMFSLGVALRNDLGDPVPTVTRQWTSAATAEEWEEMEQTPSPEPIGPIHHIPAEEGEAINPAVVGAVLEEYSRQQDGDGDGDGDYDVRIVEETEPEERR